MREGIIRGSRPVYGANPPRARLTFFFPKRDNSTHQDKRQQCQNTAPINQPPWAALTPKKKKTQASSTKTFSPSPPQTTAALNQTAGREVAPPHRCPTITMEDLLTFPSRGLIVLRNDMVITPAVVVGGGTIAIMNRRP